MSGGDFSAETDAQRRIIAGIQFAACRDDLISLVEGAPGIPGNLAVKFVDANKRAFRASRWPRPVLSLATRLTELHRSCETEPPLDMLMTLQGVYEKSLGRLSPSLRRAPRWTRSG